MPVTDSWQEEIVWFPRDFLTKRSPAFDTWLCGTGEHIEQSPLILENVSSGTLREFYRWSMMENPHIRHDACFEEVDALAELAEKYQIHALGWQASDRIRQQLHSGLWHLTPKALSSKYKHLASSSWLLQLYRAALGTATECVPDRTDYDVAEWRRAVSETPALGLDYIEAQIRRYDRDSLRQGGPCRFHDHGKQALPQECKDSEWPCPFRDGGCFTVEDEGKEGNEMRKKGGKRRAKQPRTADEMDLGNFHSLRLGE